MQPRARIFSNISTPFSRGKSPTFRLYCIFEFMNDLHFHCVFSLTHCTQIVPILPFFLAYSYILLLHWVYMVWRLHFPFLQIIGDTNVMGSDGVWGREVIERGSEKRKKIKGLCFCMKNERGRKIWQVESANDPGCIFQLRHDGMTWKLCGLATTGRDISMGISTLHRFLHLESACDGNFSRTERQEHNLTNI